MSSRLKRSEVAKETVEISNRGEFEVDGVTISIADSVTAMRDGTRLYTPKELDELVSATPQGVSYDTQMEVRNCTTIAAAKALIEQGVANPLCLNFASAKNPGGGFLKGCNAQEESLCRASTLFESLSREEGYYKANWKFKSTLYTNHMIYSPSVAVFRGDDDKVVARWFNVDVITAPAVNAGAFRSKQDAQVEDIATTMQHRIRCVLSVAQEHGHSELVLGAWGTGVFRNDSKDVAQWFADALRSPRFVGVFRRVVFAVLDWERSTPTYNAFASVFC